ncbi:LamG-like jellyroll fold domain-containing protein [[Eubacterium] cellulosolvens]
MIKNKIISLIIMGLLIAILFNLPATIWLENQNGSIESLHSTISDNLDDQTSNIDLKTIGIRGSRSSNQKENNLNGGSWVDSFKDNSGINVVMSDYIKNVNEDVIINSSAIDSNTIALWHFNEGTGSTVYDATTNNNDGTRSGAIWTTGRFGGALSFDGSNDFVNVGTLANIHKPITIETWIYPTSVTTNQLIFGRNAEINYGYHYENSFLVNRTRELFIMDRDPPSAYRVTTTARVSENNWHYVAVTRDNSNNIEIYINGSSVLSENLGGDRQLTGRSYRLGRTNTGHYAYAGKIDEMRISNVARTPQEIKSAYENQTYIYSYFKNGYLTSNPITLPSGMKWDTIVFDKTEDTNTWINITILDASNDKPIPGSPIYFYGGEYDISYIDPVTYPSIKLNATFYGDGFSTPSLHYWGVSWIKSNTWRDTIFGGVKLESHDLVNISDGNAEFRNTGTLCSKSISIPDKCYYDKLIVNKTEPTGTSLKISVLNAQTNNGISGFTSLTGNNIDLTSLDPTTYPSIKLKAICTSSGAEGILHDWSANWTTNAAPKIQDINSIQTINRTQSAKFFINLSDNETPENELTLIIRYKYQNIITWATDYLCTPTFINDHWECNFTPPADAKLGLYDFDFSCQDEFQAFGQYSEQYSVNVLNNIPTIWEIILDPVDGQVNRTKAKQIMINATDVETPRNALDLDIKYKSPFDLSWKSNYITNKKYINDVWEIEFKPPNNAELGLYIINVTCNDSVTEVYQEIEIQVINNLPTQPEISIIPFEPFTTDHLELSLKKSTDVETSFNKIKYWYYWYKDNSPMPEFENSTIIFNTATKRYETWRCRVYPFDGDELGPYAEDEVIIQNSPPALVEQFNKLEMFEDVPVVLENKLRDIFNDPDGDELEFTITGQQNIKIDIILSNGTLVVTPDQNWFGTEVITIAVDDKVAPPTEAKVEIIVKPTNDLPKITQVGSQIVTGHDPELTFVAKQNEPFNLPISVVDIDGDDARGMIRYILNITERSNLFFQENDKKLFFQPTNDDVGWLYISIQITDNNETPLIYVTQDIRIQILNLNDPPSVRITEPTGEFLVFLEGQEITLDCVVDDIDLLVPDSKEGFRFLWYSNKTGLESISTSQRITVTPDLLKPGKYNISVRVQDSGGETATDSINIEIKALKKDEPTETTFNISSWLWLIILIIIIVIVLVASIVVISQKKKRRLAAMGIPEGTLLQPDAAYLPPVGGSTPAETTTPRISRPHIIQGEPIPAPKTQPQLEPAETTVSTAPPQASLPPVQQTQPTVQTGSSPEEKLRLLEERLLHGEIDQELYESLKAKYEFEVQPYQPPPQLPPASAPPSTSPTSSTPSQTTTAPPVPTAEPTPVPTPTQTTPTVAQPPAQPSAQPQPPGQPQPQAQPQVPQHQPSSQQPQIKQIEQLNDK